MGTPLGDFIRTRRDTTRPETLGLPAPQRQRSPGLRRVDLASRAGISVEYLTRIEQGRDTNPSISVLGALADALGLVPAERNQLRYLAKITGGQCVAHAEPVPRTRELRPPLIETLGLLEPGIAVVLNKLGDILAYTSGYEALTSGSGLLDHDAPNLTRYVFTDPRARSFFADWGEIADEQLFDLWHGPGMESSERLAGEIAESAGPDFTSRLNRHAVPARGPLVLNHPSQNRLRLHREVLEIPADNLQLVVCLPADEHTADVVDRWRQRGTRLQLIS